MRVTRSQQQQRSIRQDVVEVRFVDDNQYQKCHPSYVQEKVEGTDMYLVRWKRDKKVYRAHILTGIEYVEAHLREVAQTAPINPPPQELANENKVAPKAAQSAPINPHPEELANENEVAPKAAQAAPINPPSRELANENEVASKAAQTAPMNPHPQELANENEVAPKAAETAPINPHPQELANENEVAPKTAQAAPIDPPPLELANENVVAPKAASTEYEFYGYTMGLRPRKTRSLPDVGDFTDYDDSDSESVYSTDEESKYEPKRTFLKALQERHGWDGISVDLGELRDDQSNESSDSGPSENESDYVPSGNEADYRSGEASDGGSTDEESQHPASVSSASNEVTKPQKKWDKQRYCKFCLKTVQKLPRHLEVCHKDEREVAQFLAFKPKSKERRVLLDKIRSVGGFIHNRQVIMTQKGELYQKRRQNAGYKKVPKDEYLPCPYCKEMFKKNYLHRHRAKAHKNEFVKGSRVQATAFLLLPKQVAASPLFERDVLQTMEPDQVGRLAQTDELIIERGQKLYESLGSRTDQKHYIAAKMREMARFLLSMREITGNDSKSLASCLRGPQVNNIIAAVKKAAKYDETTMRFGTPSLALKIGHGLNECAAIMKGKAAEDENQQLITGLDNFQSALKVKWSTLISSGALRTLRRKRWNKEATVPLAEDIRKFNTYLQEKIELNLRKIMEIADPEYLLELAKLLLCLMITFNRRRSGEVAKMLLQDVRAARTGDVQEDILQKLSPLEQKLAGILTRFEIRGKRDRGVPVLLTPLMKRATDVLKMDIHRQLMGINPDNKYFFALPGRDSHIIPSAVFKKYATACGASKPQFLKSTNMRKNFASMCTLENLKDNELDVVADFMGHDIRIHRSFYRLPQSTLQIVKMGKLIAQKESGIILEDVDSVDDVPIEEFTNVVDSDNDDDSDCSTKSENERKTAAEEVQPYKRKHAAKEEQPCDTKCVPEERQPTKKKRVAEEEQPSKQKRGWTEEENKAIQKYFGGCITARILPGKARIEEVQGSCAALKGRSWKNIKDKIRNTFPKDKL